MLGKRFIVLAFALFSAFSACRPVVAPPRVDASDASFPEGALDAEFYKLEAGPNDPVCVRACISLAGNGTACPEANSVCVNGCEEIQDAGLGGFDPKCILDHAGDLNQLWTVCHVCKPTSLIEKAGGTALYQLTQR